MSDWGRPSQARWNSHCHLPYATRVMSDLVRCGMGIGPVSSHRKPLDRPSYKPQKASGSAQLPATETLWIGPVTSHRKPLDRPSYKPQKASGSAQLPATESLWIGPVTSHRKPLDRPTYQYQPLSCSSCHTLPAASE